MPKSPAGQRPPRKSGSLARGRAGPPKSAGAKPAKGSSAPEGSSRPQSRPNAGAHPASKSYSQKLVRKSLAGAKQATVRRAAEHAASAERPRAPAAGTRTQRSDRANQPGRPTREAGPTRSAITKPVRSRGSEGRARAEPSARSPSFAASTDARGPAEPMRIAKAMARAGLCSRREAERWIADGRVSVNGRVLPSPAVEVGPADRILVDGAPLPAAAPAQLWRYHKPRGLVTTHADPEGRPAVFDNLPPDMPRVVSIGRLDFNTEGLLLLTNDGELARHLELPATGWLRRYRVRAHGRVSQADLDSLKDGVVIEGVRYGGIEASIDSVQSGNMWLTIGLREGKNREVRRILATLALDVNRLIRVSYGPFQLMDLAPGTVEAVKRRVLADQLGPEAERFGLTGAIDGFKAREAGRAKPTPGRDPRDGASGPRKRER
jgi:23S rRNA pseudouridine2605 synthase